MVPRHSFLPTRGSASSCGAALCIFCLFLFLLAAAKADCRVEKIATVPLARSANGWLVKAKINGTVVPMVLDTGARTMVTPQAQDRLALPLNPGTGLMHGVTAKNIPVQSVTIDDFEFASGHFSRKSVQVADIPRHEGMQEAGLLGIDMLANYDFELDFNLARLTLYRAEGCKSVKPDWTGDYSKTSFLVGPAHKIILPAELNGHRVTAEFDTGADLSSISADAIRKVGLTRDTLEDDQAVEGVGVGNIRKAQRVHKFENFSVAGMTLPNKYVAVMNVPLGEADMLLGRDFMAQNRFWISFATQTMFFQPQSQQGETASASWRAEQQGEFTVRRPALPTVSFSGNSSLPGSRQVRGPADLCNGFVKTPYGFRMQTDADKPDPACKSNARGLAGAIKVIPQSEVSDAGAR